jgi:hypothetical protein
VLVSVLLMGIYTTIIFLPAQIARFFEMAHNVAEHSHNAH